MLQTWVSWAVIILVLVAINLEQSCAQHLDTLATFICNLELLLFQHYYQLCFSAFKEDSCLDFRCVWHYRQNTRTTVRCASKEGRLFCATPALEPITWSVWSQSLRRLQKANGAVLIVWVSGMISMGYVVLHVCWVAGICLVCHVNDRHVSDVVASVS